MTCSHGYNGTATFGWVDNRLGFTRADDRICVSASAAEDSLVHDTYDVLDQCSDLPGVVRHAKKRDRSLALGGFIRSGRIWISSDEDEVVEP